MYNIDNTSQLCCLSPKEDPYWFWKQEVKANLGKFEYVVGGCICPFRTGLVILGNKITLKTLLNPPFLL